MTPTGGLTASGHLRVGSNTAPVNTTAGDLTVGRLMVGTNQGFSGGVGSLAYFQGTKTDTGAGSTIGVGAVVVAAPVSNSAAEFRSFNMGCQANAPGINFTVALKGGYFNVQSVNAGTIASTMGVHSFGLFLGGSAATMGTVTSAIGGDFQAVSSFSNALSSTVTSAYAVVADNSLNAGSGPLTITGLAGVAIDQQTTGANNTNLLVGTKTIPSGAFNIYSPSTRDNYLAGSVGIGLTAPAAKLDVDGPVRVKSYTVAGVPSAAAGAGQIIYVSNETGGAVLAFSDGTNWRRVTDRVVVS
jgi:hypothetical protein